MLADSPDSNAPPSGIAIDLRRLPWAGRLVRDYCHTFDRLEPFYAGSPTAESTWERVLAARHARAIAPGLVDVLSRQLTARDAPTEARTAAERLGAPGTVAIITGQQAGLFGGPLFTLLKALTCLKLAHAVARDHGATVVPIFWVDAEDHDLDEIRTCHVLDGNLEPHPVTLELAARSGATAGSVRLDATIAETIAHLRDLLPETEFTTDAMAGLETTYAEGTGLVEAFARWIDMLLGSHGLVVFDASDPAAKPLVRDVFEHELQAPGVTSRLAASAGADLVTRGYHAQVEPQPDTVALFQLDGARQPIRCEDGGFAAGDRRFSAAALLGEVEADPGHFSPNVLLRPIVQDALFPTVGYVAGPNELAYLGQLRGVYEHFDVPMPVIYPRASATLVDTATLRFLTRHDLSFEELQPRDDATLNRLLESLLPAAVEQAVTDTDRAIGDQLAALKTAVPAVDPTLAGAVESTRGRMERDLRNLRGKIIQAAKRRDDTLRRQFHRARAQSFPHGEPQERKVGFVYFLNRYGPALIERLMAELPLDPRHHWLLTI